ncbi:MAG: hypothetical protein LBT27_03035, partial [Prevotellaceae bacterium]|nr:hypothetical protein [Prevotellaceae bacterium]
DEIKAVELCNTALQQENISEKQKIIFEQYIEYIKQTSFALTIEKQNIPNEPIKMLINYKATPKLYFRLYKTNWDCNLNMDYEIKNFPKDNERYLIKNAIKVREWNIDLSDIHDYKNHSTEIAINPLSQGQYIILACNTQNFFDEDKNTIEYAIFQVSSIAYVLRNIYGDYSSHQIYPINEEIYIANRKTGKPLQGAIMQITDKDGKVKGVFESDINGIMKIEKLDFVKYRSDLIIITHNSDTLLYGYNRVYINYWNNISFHNYQKTALFSDRAIYRPGQIVYFKGIAMTDNDNHCEIAPNRQETIILRDVNRQELSKIEVVSNEYGTFNDNFVLPQSVLGGSFSIVSSNGYGYLNFRVEEYKRPTFEVKINPVEKTFNFNELVNISGNAKSYAGYSIDNAKVSYKVISKVEFPYNWSCYSSFFYGSTRIIDNGESQTDNEGNFNINFFADDEDLTNNNQIINYQIIIDVTDNNGETHSAIYNVRISRNPLIINTNIPENINNDDDFSFDLSTKNLNGNYTESDITVKIYSLKSQNKILRKRLWEAPSTPILSYNEFKKLFPLDVYKNEDDIKTFEEKNIVKTISFNTKNTKKINLEELKKYGSGYYKIYITAKNKENVETKIFFYLQFQNSDKILNMDNWVRKGKQTEKDVEFFVGGMVDNANIHYDVIYRNDIVESKNIIVGTKPKSIKIAIPKIKNNEEFAVLFVSVSENRVYQSRHIIETRKPNDLDISLITFRDKLQPGEKERWTIRVKSQNGEKPMAEMVATLYDASLDAFVLHDWNKNFANSRILSYDNCKWTVSYDETRNRDYSLVKETGFGNRIAVILKDKGKFNFLKDNETDDLWLSRFSLSYSASVSSIQQEYNQEYSNSPKIRTNFNETAFFYPELRTDENGEIIIDFVIPETLTRWKMLGLAHTKNLETGKITAYTVTQKEVAITANAPRFFRQGDAIEFSAKINNVSEKDIKGKAQLLLFDAFTMQPVNIIEGSAEQTFAVKINQSAALKWNLKIPSDVDAITYRVLAIADKHSDGEEKTIPVLPNSMLVTESLPFTVRANQSKNFSFDKLINNTSSTLKNYSYTLEFTSNPVWYAVQAIPYMMEYPYECSEQIFSRFYANSISASIVDKFPQIKRTFDLWKMKDSKELLSNLEKNQELKNVLLEETPWLRTAKTESENKKRIALLFDLNKMQNEQKSALNKLKQNQMSNGAFAWFGGMCESRYITQHIAIGLQHLKKLQAVSEIFKSDVDKISDAATKYLDAKMLEDYNYLLKNKVDLQKYEIMPLTLHYLYLRSFAGIDDLSKEQKTAFDYFLNKIDKNWVNQGIYQQALIAIITHRFGKINIAQKIINSLKERAQTSEEMGMYWAENRCGYYWYQSPIETQSLLIEAFSEIGNNKNEVEEMKIWLLRNKQTNNWETTKATAEACYALLSQGENNLSDNALLQIKINEKPLEELKNEDLQNAETGTGYVKTTWHGDEIQNNFGKINVTNTNKTIGWGAAYWQYFENLDKITSAETGLKIKREYFITENTDNGAKLNRITEKSEIKVGDKVKVRIELRADRDYEYVHLKDMRASGFEPVNVLSQSKYQDGIWYYENTKDASTNFFIYELKKGTYVFEYDLRANNAGEFSAGIATFQCMYAPEFSAHSNGEKLKIKN